MSRVFHNGQELSVREEAEGYSRHWAWHLQKHSKIFKGQGDDWLDWNAGAMQDKTSQSKTGWKEGQGNTEKALTCCVRSLSFTMGTRG